MEKVVSYVDEKELKPNDKFISKEEYNKHYNKPTRGFVVISDESGNVLETPNLVLLSGREFLAQKLADIPSSTLMPEENTDLTNYKIRYFGVGTGGADTAEQPNKIGPFDNDLGLLSPGKFADNNADNYQYIHDGKLKSILSDSGSIEIIRESHEVVVNGNVITLDAYTTIKYTMNVRKDELYKESDELGPFAFNEAALYAVDFDGNIPNKTSDNTESSRYSANYRAFARFTTLTKWLEVKDSLKIEWYILV